MTARLAIAVFARAPVPGAAKTRLIPLLGATGAARLQQQLTERAVATARAVPGAAVSLWVAGDRGHPAIDSVAQRHGVAVHPQAGPDLGARMAHAFDMLLAQAARVVLIGTDCPALTAADLAAAAQALAEHDVVLQPAHDGGYVLVALRAPLPGLFAGIAWGTDAVLAQSRARAAALGARVHLAAARPDLDTPADYAQALAAGWIDAVPTEPAA